MMQTIRKVYVFMECASRLWASIRVIPPMNKGDSVHIKLDFDVEF